VIQIGHLVSNVSLDLVAGRITASRKDVLHASVAAAPLPTGPSQCGNQWQDAIALQDPFRASIWDRSSRFLLDKFIYFESESRMLTPSGPSPNQMRFKDGGSAARPPETHVFQMVAKVAIFGPSPIPTAGSTVPTWSTDGNITSLPATFWGELALVHPLKLTPPPSHRWPPPLPAAVV
jgi:hypothetical protein